MKTVKVKLGKGRNKCKLPNGVVIRGKGSKEVEYTPFISRAIRFGDLEKVVVVPKKKAASSGDSNKTGDK